MIDSVIRLAETGEIPAGNHAEVIERDRHALEAWLAHGRRAYGSSTLLGHRDDRPAGTAGERAVLDDHCVEGEGFLTRTAVRLVTSVKWHQLALGATGVSTGAFAAVTAAAHDTSFAPPVPTSSTYGSGDVIPAAWWARAMCDSYSPELKPGDAIALINGNFVHLGVAIDHATRSSALHARVREAIDAARDIGSAGPTGPKDRAARAPRGTQDPVSVRAASDVAENYRSTVAHFSAAIDAALARPSGNPLVLDGVVYEQASFLATGVAVAGSALNHALVLLATVAARTTTWLSAGAPGLPDDLATVDRPMGAVQISKAAEGELARLRLSLGSAPAVLSGATSRGVEDLWLMGVLDMERANAALAITERICGLLELTTKRARDLLDGGA